MIEEYIKEKGKKAYKQAELLRILLATDKDYTASELADLAGTSTNTIAILVDKGILKYEEIVQERRPFLGNELKIEPPYQATPWQKEVIREIKNKSTRLSTELFSSMELLVVGKQRYTCRL